MVIVVTQEKKTSACVSMRLSSVIRRTTSGGAAETQCWFQKAVVQEAGFTVIRQTYIVF